MKIEDLKGSGITVVGYQLLVKPIIFEEQKEKSGIIKPTEFVKKINGEKHTIVTKEGMVNMLEVIEVGENVKSVIKGDYIRIRPRLPEDIVDLMLSAISGMPIGVVSSTEIIAVIKTK